MAGPKPAALPAFRPRQSRPGHPTSREPRLIGLAPALVLASLSAPAPALPSPAAPLPATSTPAASLASATAILPGITPAMAEPTPALLADAPKSPLAPHEKPAESETIVVAAAPRTIPGDPFQSVNATSFAITQDVDRAIIAPVAMAYKQVVPEPMRDGLRNALRNINEPVIVLNFLLQLKPGKAGETFGRFAINSTIGVAGLFDMAGRAPINLPRRANGLAYTMGYYGIRPGPYFFLPLIGPTTLRDALGGGLDRMVVPLAVGQPFNQLAYSVPTSLLSTLNRRVEIDETIHHLRDDSANPYAAFRSQYLQKRQAEINALRGGKPQP